MNITYCKCKAAPLGRDGMESIGPPRFACSLTSETARAIHCLTYAFHSCQWLFSWVVRVNKPSLHFACSLVTPTDEE
ncbi:hypothetical protein PRIPAC_87816 [Pristionchus pacificus]|uniref:Uncharacterized protein n=1 Tax=Pristionchus pacificus TaxID=54126 RepID=A0A2A6CV80_PRIPA|nr:hypothetical protein PRIPAC_87816 [Pristionchus pacificus]|eukprot:PDM82069.1 hypothetical protein PRIPAC_36462 [Pristionchus pacificus]